jgi:hypothetical protein
MSRRSITSDVPDRDDGLGIGLAPYAKQMATVVHLCGLLRYAGQQLRQLVGAAIQLMQLCRLIRPYRSAAHDSTVLAIRMNEVTRTPLHYGSAAASAIAINWHRRTTLSVVQ